MLLPASAHICVRHMCITMCVCVYIRANKRAIRLKNQEGIPNGNEKERGERGRNEDLNGACKRKCNKIGKSRV